MKRKKRRKSSPICFRNFFVNYERRGELIKWGVQIAIIKILNLGLPEYFRSKVDSGGSNPARLGELGGNLLRLFPINRRKGVVPMIHHPPGYAFQLFWVKTIVSVKKIQVEVLS